MTEIAAWLALLRTPGIGPATFFNLLENIGDPETILANPEAIPRLSAPIKVALSSPDWAAVDLDLKWAAQPDRHILIFTSVHYPVLLRQIPDPPPLLFVHGDPSLLASHQLAVVGSRNPTTGGRDNAFEFARHLAGVGLAITSGLALGIDGAAHRGALAAGGKTLAITGTGLDRVYPSRHKDLAHEIIDKGGALVCEFPIGTPALPQNFPRRNRIISGLTLGTLVVEAARQSGSLITARLAGDQGREVFAIPGSIHNPLAKGCHALIRQGGKLVETAEDVLEELRFQFTPKLSGDTPRAGVAPEFELGAEYQTLLEFLGYEPLSVDTLIERCGLTAETVSSMLLVLELHSYVESLPGGRYSRVEKRA